MCRLSNTGCFSSSFINKLHNNRSFIRHLQREYSIIKQHTSGLKDSFLQINQTRKLHRLCRNIRNISSLLMKCGFHREANMTKAVAAQVRCFSTSRTYRNKDDEDKEKHNDDKDEEENDPNKPAKIALLRVLTAVLAVFSLAVIYSSNNVVSEVKQISWKEFYHELLLKGEVERIDVYPGINQVMVYPHRGVQFKGGQRTQESSPLQAPTYILRLPDENTARFEDRIREAEKEIGIAPENGVVILYKRQPGGIAVLVQVLMAAVVLVGLRYILRKVMKGGGTNIFDSVRKANFTRVDVKSQHGKGTTFKDVAGLQEAKVEVMEFVDYLKNPERYEVLGAKVPRGALLLGPPGCGKTLLAKAVATEAQVPFLAMAGSEFVEMIGGLGASRVRSLFQEARKSSPCIVYIDEIDAIGRKRSGNANSGEEEQTLNQLLVEMDGMGTTAGVIVLASTNRADVLDKALLRPGRFDRHITIDYPTLAERKDIFEMYLRTLKLKTQSAELPGKLSQLTPGMSGADIANICNEAALHAARVKKTSIEAVDFDYAVERVIAGVAKKSSILSPAEKKIIAYHESGHALVGWMLEHTDALLKISIIPRTSSVLGFAQYSPSDKKLYTTEQLFEKMCMALGGRVAESLIFNKVTTGAQDDLKKVTKLAYNQIRSFGMNERVGYISFPDNDNGEFGMKPYSKRLAATIDEEARSLVAKAYKYTEKLLTENTDKLHSLATTLLEKEVMTYNEVERLIGAPPHGAKHRVELVDTEMESLSNNSENNGPPENYAS